MDLRSAIRASTRGSRRRAANLGVGAIIALALVVSVASLALAAPSFPDVPSSHPYYDAINDLASRGIIGGYANGTFGPSDPVTRQQFAKMIVKTLSLPVSEWDNWWPFTDVMTDLPSEDPLYPDHYIAVCAAHGITTGKTATTFDPYSNISRYQVISMVVRGADGLVPGLLIVAPAGWAGSVGWESNPTHGANAGRAEYNGLLAGLGLAALDPYGNMSRGEVALVLHNLRDKLTSTPYTTATTLHHTSTTSRSTTTSSGSTTTTTGVAPTTTAPADEVALATAPTARKARSRATGSCGGCFCEDA